MDLFSLLGGFKGGKRLTTQGPRGKNPGAPLTPLPAKAMIRDGQPGGYRIEATRKNPMASRIQGSEIGDIYGLAKGPRTNFNRFR